MGQRCPGLHDGGLFVWPVQYWPPGHSEQVAEFSGAAALPAWSPVYPASHTLHLPVRMLIEQGWLHHIWYLGGGWRKCWGVYVVTVLASWTTTS